MQHVAEVTSGSLSAALNINIAASAIRANVEKRRYFANGRSKLDNRSSTFIRHVERDEFVRVYEDLAYCHNPGQRELLIRSGVRTRSEQLARDDALYLHTVHACMAAAFRRSLSMANTEQPARCSTSSHSLWNRIGSEMARWSLLNSKEPEANTLLPDARWVERRPTLIRDQGDQTQQHALGCRWQPLHGGLSRPDAHGVFHWVIASTDASEHGRLAAGGHPRDVRSTSATSSCLLRSSRPPAPGRGISLWRRPARRHCGRPTRHGGIPPAGHPARECAPAVPGR